MLHIRIVHNFSLRSGMISNEIARISYHWKVWSLTCLLHPLMRRQISSLSILWLKRECSSETMDTQILCMCIRVRTTESISYSTCFLHGLWRFWSNGRFESCVLLHQQTIYSWWFLAHKEHQRSLFYHLEKDSQTPSFLWLLDFGL